MIEISLCMIVKNEEETLERCLTSVKDLVDEIVIVDTGSTDKTKEIAKKYTDKIYDFEWIDDFSAARNFAFSKGTKEYLMWIDADDVIDKEEGEKLLKLKKELDGSADIVMMKYNSGFDAYGNPMLSYYRERLMKREKEYKWVDPVHEVISLTGNVIYKDIAVSHKKIHSSDPKRNLEIYNKAIEQGTILNPRQQFYYSRELYYNKEYEKSEKSFNEYLDSGKGWSENCISACKDLSNVYYAINKPEEALRILFRSFEYGTPRGEFACDIAKHFLDREKYDLAIYWYNVALESKIDDTNGGFYNMDYYNYIPYLGLCVVYYRKGDLVQSKKYNEKALKIKPKDITCINNKKFFK